MFKIFVIFIFLIVCLVLFFLIYGAKENSFKEIENQIAKDGSFSTPEMTLRTYLEALREEDFSKVDSSFTKEFQEFIKTDENYKSHRHIGQLRNQYRYLADYVKNKNYEVEMYENKAIIRFEPMFKRPAPQYFVKEGNEWKIDAMFSFNNIIMEDSQSWHWRNSNIDNEKRWLNNQ